MDPFNYEGNNARIDDAVVRPTRRILMSLSEEAEYYS